MSSPNGDEGEEEVFEIEDFTTASEWEVFTARVEEAFHAMRVCGEHSLASVSQPLDLSACHWKEVKHVLSYLDFPFELTYYSAIPDRPISPSDETTVDAEESMGLDKVCMPATLASIDDCENCFPSRAHCIARWYGLREFMVISPVSNNCSVAPSKARLILSSLTIAATNTNCQIALLVQVLRPVDRMFLGTLTASGLRANMDMIHLRMSPPSECFDYDGLLRLLADRVGHTCLELQHVVASVRFTYSLHDWPEEACWAQQPPDLDLDLDDSGGDLCFSGLSRLPLGLLYDPVRELQLSAVWPRLPHGSFEDSSTLLSLDPLSAPLWTAKVMSAAGGGERQEVAGLLGEHLVEFLAVCRDDRTVPQLLGHEFGVSAVEQGLELSAALNRLTEHRVPSLGSVIMGTRRTPGSGGHRGPLSQEVLVTMLNFLFPDDEEGEDSAYDSGCGTFRVPPWPCDVIGLPQQHPLDEVSAGVKGVPAEGLLWRLSIVICHAIHSLGGLPALAHLLYEIRLELRFRWDSGLLVPGVTTAVPDLSAALLQQKLQMLNCCIAHRTTREAAVAVNTPKEKPEDAEEFFDCLSEDEDGDEEEENYDANEAEVRLSSWDRPEGRLRQCGRLRLLNTGARLFVPVTQDPAPVTEDTLEEQAEVLLRLGDTDQGSAMRARLLSSSLLSDMEAFKAANPGCVLADFVRWYSPRDWVETGKASPCLSERMTLPGNLWQEVWQNAHPVPARRQKRLFDEAREAERVLHWVSELSPGALCRQLLPSLLHAAACRLAEEPSLYTLPSAAVYGPKSDSSSMGELQHGALPALLAVVVQRLGRLSRQPCDLNRYSEVAEQLIAIEKCIGRAQSLRHKFISLEPRPGNETASDDDEKVLLELISSLLCHSEVKVEGAAKGVPGQAILRLFDRALEYQERGASHITDRTSLPPSQRRSLSESTRTRLGYASAREYVIRARAAYPNKVASRVMPHRIYATFMAGDMRIAGLFTQDTVYS